MDLYLGKCLTPCNCSEPEPGGGGGAVSEPGHSRDQPQRPYRASLLRLCLGHATGMGVVWASLPPS